MADKEAPPVFPIRPSKGMEHPSTGTSSIARIGRSIFIKGELSGQEDLTIDGIVEGVIELDDHNLTIEQNARINAKIRARNVVIRGEVVGEIDALERVEIQSMGRLQGNILSPRVVIADAAHFKGSVDMPDHEPQGEEEKEAPADSAVAADNHQPPLEASPSEELIRWA